MSGVCWDAQRWMSAGLLCEIGAEDLKFREPPLLGIISSYLCSVREGGGGVSSQIPLTTKLTMSFTHPPVCGALFDQHERQIFCENICAPLPQQMPLSGMAGLLYRFIRNPPDPTHDPTPHLFAGRYITQLVRVCGGVISPLDGIIPW